MRRSFLHRLLPAVLAALVLSACLDPVAPPSRDATLSTARKWPSGPIEEWPVRDRLDTSRRLVRILTAVSESTYSYLRVEDANPLGGLMHGAPDSTRVDFIRGLPVEREASYFGEAKPPVPREGEPWILPVTVARLHYLEGVGSIGTHAGGAPALSLDSLYGACLEMMPAEPGPDFVLEFNGEGFLRKCGPARGACAGTDCPRPITVEILSMSPTPGPLKGCLPGNGTADTLYRTETIP